MTYRLILDKEFGLEAFAYVVEDLVIHLFEKWHLLHKYENQPAVDNTLKYIVLELITALECHILNAIFQLIVMCYVFYGWM